MKSIHGVIFCLWLFSCGPESNLEGCSLESEDGKPYVGFVRLCNGIPGQQQDFPAETFLNIINDTLISFQIESLNPAVSFDYNVTVISECGMAEDEYRHLLYDTMTNELLGSIGLNKTSIFLKLETNPCLDNGTFSGVLK